MTWRTLYVMHRLCVILYRVREEHLFRLLMVVTELSPFHKG